MNLDPNNLATNTFLHSFLEEKNSISNEVTEEVADEENDVQQIAVGLGEDTAPYTENTMEPTGLASDLVGGVRQLPERKDIKLTVAKRIIRHLTSGEPGARAKAFAATAVMLRYICDIMGVSHADIPEGSRGGKQALMDAILNRVFTFTLLLSAHPNLQI